MHHLIPELFDRICDAAVEPELWPALMREVASAIHSGNPAEDRSGLSAHFVRRHGLTPAEARVGAALCRGYSPAEIARLANISVHTVRSHLKSIQSRLGVHGQAQIVAELLCGPGFVQR